MVEYLRKTIQLCEKQGVEVCLYNAPLHPSFKRRIPSQAMVDFAKVRDELLASFPKVRYVDHVDEPLPDHDYYDGDHVNRVSAQIVTEKLLRQKSGRP
jgi:hypothetical protein